MQNEIQSLVKLLKRSQNCPINVLTWQDRSVVVIPSGTKVEGHLVRRFCPQIRVLTPAIMTSRPPQFSPPVGTLFIVIITTTTSQEMNETRADLVEIQPPPCRRHGAMEEAEKLTRS